MSGWLATFEELAPGQLTVIMHVDGPGDVSSSEIQELGSSVGADFTFEDREHFPHSWPGARPFPCQTRDGGYAEPSRPCSSETLPMDSRRVDEKTWPDNLSSAA